MMLTVNTSARIPAFAPKFREGNAVCIEVPAASRRSPMPPPMPPMPQAPLYSAQDRLAQLNYFAQSIAQSLPVLHPEAVHVARYAHQAPRFSFSV